MMKNKKYILGTLAALLLGMGAANADPILSLDPAAQAAVSHTEYLREAGSEGIELVMWLIMRGALDADVREVHRMHHVPTSNTSNGLVVLENA